MNNPSPLKQLQHIRELLERNHPAIDQADIYRRVDRALREANYARHPYDLHFEGVHRASSDMNESWFCESDGHTPDLGKLHCPPDPIASLQRCNWAGDPVFYCSTENGVPVFEVKAKKGSTVVITVWIDNRNTVEDVERFYAGGQLPYHIDIMGLAVGVERIVASLKEDHPARELLLKDDFFSPDTPEIIRDVDRYIGELFTESVDAVPNLYWFTSAIARSLLHKLVNSRTGERLGGFIYPSVESKFSGYNIVFNKDFARNWLKIYSSSMYRVEDYDPAEPRYSLKPLKGLAGNPGTGNYWRNIHGKYDADRFELSPSTPTLSTNSYLDWEGEN